MPILGALSRHNPVLKRFYEQLKNQEKPPKVALIACMRKLIVIANAMLLKKERWKVELA